MSFQIEYYTSAENKNDFIVEFTNFPKVLYADNNKINKLPFEIESLYFKLHHLTHDFFLIKENGVVVLRSMICLTPFPDLAYFGLLDFDYKNVKVKNILSEFKKMINSWCQIQGASKIYGPINFSTWLPYRLLSSVDGGPMFSFEPDRPIEYCQLLKEVGFTTNQLFSSKGYEELDTIINIYKSDY
jgi:Leucine-rich repeat (LRR) protein